MSLNASSSFRALFPAIAVALGPIRGRVTSHPDELALVDAAIVALRDAEENYGAMVKADVDEAIEAGLSEFAQRMSERLTNLAETTETRLADFARRIEALEPAAGVDSSRWAEQLGALSADVDQRFQALKEQLKGAGGKRGGRSDGAAAAPPPAEVAEQPEKTAEETDQGGEGSGIAGEASAPASGPESGEGGAAEGSATGEGGADSL